MFENGFLLQTFLPQEKPYEISFRIKINDMNQFISDLKLLFQSHWKIILLIGLVIWAISSYTDIKSGILDGWNAK